MVIGVFFRLIVRLIYFFRNVCLGGIILFVIYDILIKDWNYCSVVEYLF